MGGQRRQVVVIGGSFAGRRAARQLRPHFDVTIVDAKASAALPVRAGCHFLAP